MKQLEILTNVDRAKLLHELRPLPIKDYLEYAKGLIGYLQAHQKEIEPTWTNDMFSFQYWLSLALDVEKRIERYGDQLCKSSRLFSDQLFNGMLALWSADALLKYTETTECKDTKFKHLATGLFGSTKVLTTDFDKRFQQLTGQAVQFIQQKVEAAKKIVLHGNASQQSGCMVHQFIIQFETFIVQELEIQNTDIVIRGTLNPSHDPHEIDIQLQHLDGACAVAIADYLSKDFSW
jgi:hypothetical protein